MLSAQDEVVGGKPMAFYIRKILDCVLKKSGWIVTDGFPVDHAAGQTDVVLAFVFLSGTSSALIAGKFHEGLDESSTTFNSKYSLTVNEA